VKPARGTDTPHPIARLIGAAEGRDFPNAD
jgi:hypothetical protein